MERHNLQAISMGPFTSFKSTRNEGCRGNIHPFASFCIPLQSEIYWCTFFVAFYAGETVLFILYYSMFSTASVCFPIFLVQYLPSCLACYDCYKSIFRPACHYNHWIYKWTCTLILLPIGRRSGEECQAIQVTQRMAGESCLIKAQKNSENCLWSSINKQRQDRFSWLWQHPYK